MERNINGAIERILMENKDWDFALLFFDDKKPMLIERASDIKRIGNSDTLMMNSIVMNPFPQSEADAMKQFDMQSYINTTAISAVDFYVERRIKTAPASVLSIVDH